MKLAAVVFAAFLVAPYAVGQKLELKLDAIAARASAKSEVDLDGPLLQMALGKASVAVKEAEAAKEGKDGKKSNLPALAAGIKGVYVRNYTFDKPGVYSDAELESLRRQVDGSSGWSRIVNIKEKNESTEIYLMSQGDQVSGCFVLVAEPKELTVVNLVGAMNLANLKELVNSNIHYDLSTLMAPPVK
jgi:hypothetical protein